MYPNSNKTQIPFVFGIMLGLLLFLRDRELMSSFNFSFGAFYGGLGVEQCLIDLPFNSGGLIVFA